MSYPMTISRIASAIVALVYLVTAYFGSEEGHVALLQAIGALALPLALIWFPEELGDYIGPVRGGYISKESPALLVAAMGWLLLVGLPLVAYLIWQYSEPAS